jgi:hypothetical protein
LLPPELRIFPTVIASFQKAGKNFPMISFKLAARGAVLVLACASASACASLVGEGSSQTIAIMTNPAGATCTLIRHGETIGKIETPGNIMVKRRKYDITIKCNKPGYAEAEYLNKSGLSSMVAGNVAADLILTAGISSIVDSANGADNEYTSPVVISLNPITAAAPVQPSAMPVSTATGN